MRAAVVADTLVLANLLRTEHFWGSTEVACKHGNLMHVGGLSRRCAIPHHHVFDEPSSKWCHGKLLCEQMEFAVSSGSIVSQ